MYGVWHVPRAATISPMEDSFKSPNPESWFPTKSKPPTARACHARLRVHRTIDLIQQCHRRHDALRAGFRLPPLAQGGHELDVLAVERRRRIEGHVLALAVGDRVAVD